MSEINARAPPAHTYEEGGYTDTDIPPPLQNMICVFKEISIQISLFFAV